MQRYDDFWCPLDVMTVYDDELERIGMLGPEDGAVFVDEGSADPASQDHTQRIGATFG